MSCSIHKITIAINSSNTSCTVAKKKWIYCNAKQYSTMLWIWIFTDSYCKNDNKFFLNVYHGCQHMKEKKKNTPQFKMKYTLYSCAISNIFFFNCKKKQRIHCLSANIIEILHSWLECRFSLFFIPKIKDLY